MTSIIGNIDITGKGNVAWRITYRLSGIAENTKDKGVVIKSTLKVKLIFLSLTVFNDSYPVKFGG